MKRGWFGDSWRHSLSAKGIKTGYYQRRLVAGSISGAAFKAADAARRQRAAGAGRSVEQQARISSEVLKRPLSASEAQEIAKERADLPRSPQERQARLDIPQDRAFEGMINIPEGSFTGVKTRREGKNLAKRIDTRFMSGDQGRAALSEVNRRLVIEQARQGVARNEGRIQFLQDAKSSLIRRYGTGPEKQARAEAQRFGQEQAKSRRSRAAKKGAKTRQENREKNELTPEQRAKLQKQLDEIERIQRARGLTTKEKTEQIEKRKKLAKDLQVREIKLDV